MDFILENKSGVRILLIKLICLLRPEIIDKAPVIEAFILLLNLKTV